MKLKNIIVITLLMFPLANLTKAQIKGNQTYVGASIPSSSAFMDASVTNTINGINLGKGLIFPRADIGQLVLSNQGTLYNAGNNPNRWDGMIVYNTATSATTASGISKAVTPGFYYFSNPTGAAVSSTVGEWLPLGSGSSSSAVTNVVDGTETTTNLQFNGASVYMKKGTFTTSGSSTAPTAYSSKVIIPGATASVYRVTVFKAGTGTVYNSGVYSFNTTTGDLITGSPMMSVVYPAGIYDYVVEYLK